MITDDKPTLTTYSEWQTAYDFFNADLFGNRLPECIITLDGKSKRSIGYFVPSRYKNAEDESKDGLTMNPSLFRRRDLVDTLSFLVHEMCHIWQHHFGGRKSLRTYHNKEWSKQMKRVGLMPSDTGEPGGAETGQRMSHYVIKGGLFEHSCKQLLSEEFKISWSATGWQSEFESRRHGRNKIKYLCKRCKITVWGRLNLNIACGKCGMSFIPDQAAG